MRKKFLSAFMLGLLALGTTSTITSCKDYDDDIATLKTDITSLQKAQGALEASLTSLKAALEAKDAELAALIAQKADKSELDAEITRAKAAEAALEARIQATEAAIAEIKTLLNSKVDQSAYDAKVAEIDAALAALGLADQKEAKDRADADAAIQLQIDAVNRLLIDEVIVLKQADQDLLAQIKANLEKINKNSDDIKAINDQLKAINDQLNEVLGEINTLQLLLKGSLKSLVFRPDLYYWGVEGTKLLTLDVKTWATENTAYDHEESVYQPTHRYYKDAAAFRVLDFTATYHMNPSCADPKEFKNVDVNTDDKDFYTDGAHTSRAQHLAACGLYVADWKTENGLLKVNLGVSDKNKIKNVVNNSQITVFSTEVTVASGEKGDTTITSDYATLIKDEAKALYLWHKTGKDVPTTGVKNIHVTDPIYFQCHGCGSTSTGLGHLFGNPYECGIDFLPQDTCDWNGTLDLRKLVGTHYVNENGVEKEFDVEKYGLKYKFELTGLYLKENKTSESAHAAINPEDGYTFRPQMPNYDNGLVGKQQPYGYAQDRQTIGRTPMVRVSLVDAEGTVYAYGYIRIKITEAAADVPTLKNLNIEYVGKSWTYNGECKPKPWGYTTKWIQTEYDLYNMLGLTREEFETYYEGDFADPSTHEFVQYTQTAVGEAHEIKNPETDLNTVYYEGGQFKKATRNYGEVHHLADHSIMEDGTLSSVIDWYIKADSCYQYFYEEGMKNIKIAVKYVSKNAKYPDVYVVMKTGDKIVNTPSATAEWDAAKINNYWYATDATVAKTGLDEIHANTITPEDAANNGKTIAEFTDMFSDVFYGNLASTPSTMAEILKIVDPTNGEYAADQLTVDFIFHKKNNGQEFVVNDTVNGKVVATRTYVMSVDKPGKQLSATLKGTTTTQIVAMIDGEAGNIQKQKVVLVATDFAKDLLNYKSHKNLKDAIFAVIGLKAVNKCNKKLDIDEKTFNVRFLRPLNMISANKEIEDANIEKVQEIRMIDLVKFNDWRDAWDHEDNTWGSYNYDKLVGNPIMYSLYYGIQSITIDGVADGHNVAECPYAVTNLGQADPNTFVTLASVSDQLEFIYEQPATRLSSHKIVYTNLSSTLSECVVKVPVTVTYYWGQLKGTASIKIYGSHHNAAK